MHPRSYLFVPADRPERFDKALAAGAEAVIIDLEDAVAPAAKAAARAALATWLDARPASLPAAAAAVPAIVLRCNAAATPWFEADLALAAHPAVQALMLPKAETPAAVARVVAAGGRGRALPVIALIESAAGLAAVNSLAATPGVCRLAFGSLDLQVDLGLREATEDELLPWRLALVLASRLAGIAAPIDGVSTALDDAERLAGDVARARRLGFGAKLCIHPRQVAAVRAGLRPAAAELAWAQRVLAAAAAAGGGAVAVDGRMVDKPVLLRAEAIVREAADGVCSPPQQPALGAGDNTRRQAP
ncbi:HpcH/HpaI aldolase/citrate lyase family protein [Aquabacterium sp. OR-4]|uniref:HpcH/HpaI aldolase/citrate lyase family protein n=1 Tax=Aquabacterium sp. OR-4 TaxID=2978127 RepID=UPI0021B3467B|nr:CoA ester lyase [Aquabacterium sp. OR-4]MDT7838094.1 CoA ester lyase [Aquabacterium sp. OR-4]